MALDFKLMFGLHGVIMIMFVIGGSLTIAIEAAIQVAVVTIALVVAIWVRRQRSWHWAGVSWKQVLLASLCAVLIILFLGAAIPSAPPTTSQMFPWYMGGLQIGLFNILVTLRLARMAEVDFLADCNPSLSAVETPALKPKEPRWRTWVRGGYGVVFVAIWLEGLAFFYFHGLAVRGGVSSPHGTMTDAIVEHGSTVYVTAADWDRDHLLMITMMVGIPLVLLLGAFLHFVLGVRIYEIPPFSSRLGERREG
jgi:hypothetical protein